MEWWVNLILWACVIWIPILMYFQTVNDAKFKKNIAVGVTFPQEAQTDEELLGRIAAFRRTEKRMLWGLILSGVICAVLPLSLGVMLTLYLVWLDVVIVVPFVPYVRCNRDLKAMKARRGWRRPDQSASTTVADLTPGDLWKEKRHGFVAFLIPLLLSLLPPAVAFLEGDRLWGWVMVAVGPVWVALFWILYRFAIRRKAEVVDGNADWTAALTRLRRQAWRRVWLWGAWFMALLTWCMVFYETQPLMCIIGIAAMTILFTAAVLWQEFRLRGLQARLTAESGKDFYVDEDDKWIWGMFYYNPHDDNFMVNARVGINTTVNMAKKPAKVLMGFVAVLLLLMPLFGVWIMAEERMPVEVSVEQQMLEARHAGSRYEIPLADIQSAEVLEKLPDLSRKVGTGMPTVQKGRYSAEGYGEVTACLDPRTGPWILVTEEDGTKYLLGDSSGDTSRVTAVFRAIGIW